MPDSPIILNYRWPHGIENYEAKKQLAGRVAALVKDGDTIGVGSGSSSYLAIVAVGERIKSEKLHCYAIPTSYESEIACTAAGLGIVSLWERSPDWSFDGADEVDPDGNMIKGRGGALFREKLLMRMSPRILILIDDSKRVARLGEKFAIPVEIRPAALTVVEKALRSLGAQEIVLRPAGNKDGPVITENGCFLLDARFREIEAGLEREIKSITGVLESGLFQGYTVEVMSAS